MDPLREQAVGLLNEALLASGVQQAALLAQLKELLLHRASPALLDELLPDVLALHLDRAADVRKFLAGFVQDLCLKDMHYASRCLPTHITLLRDAVPAVAKTAVTSLIAMFPKGLDAVLATREPTFGAVRLQEMWQLLNEAKELVSTFPLQHNNEGVRLHSVKFMEMLVIAYTSDSASSPSSAAANGTAAAANEGGVLHLDLADDAEAMFQRLVELVKRHKALPPQVLIVLINSASNIARQRPEFYGRMLPSLLSVAEWAQDEGFSLAVVSTLKRSLLILLKCQHDGAPPWRGRLREALSSLGAGKSADTALNQLERAQRQDVAGRNTVVKTERADSGRLSTPKDAAEPMEGVAVQSTSSKRQLGSDAGHGHAGAMDKRTRLDPAVSNVGQDRQPSSSGMDVDMNTLVATVGGLAVQGARAKPSLDGLVNSLPATILADLVIAFMLNLPSAPPPRPPGASASIGGLAALMAKSAQPQLQKQAPVADVKPEISTGPAHDARRDPRRDPRRADQKRTGVSVKGEGTHSKGERPEESDTTTSTAVRSRLLSAAIPVWTAEQRKAQRQAAVQRIIDAGVAVRRAGGGELRISVLVKLAVQAAKEDGLKDTLLQHVLADFEANQGHELAVNWLFALYSKSVSNIEDLADYRDYEEVLFALVRGIRETRPGRDKALPRLLLEAPLLVKSVLPILAELCELDGQGDLDPAMQDWVYLGLTILSQLIVHHPPMREASFDLLAKCTVHKEDLVREPAIRLAAHRLYAFEFLAAKLESFAREMLLQPTVADPLAESSASEGATDMDTGVQHADPLANTQSTESAAADGLASDPDKHELLQDIMQAYAAAPKSIKQAMVKPVSELVKVIGPDSPILLDVIETPVIGSESLVLQVVSMFTDTTEPPQALVQRMKKLYATRMQDARFLVPILPFLPKAEVETFFPSLLLLPAASFRAALTRILQGSLSMGPPMSPEEALLAIHSVHEEDVPRKQLITACNVCFAMPSVFNVDVFSKVLTQLVERVPLPLLLMRTAILSYTKYPTLAGFTQQLLATLVNKQIWRPPNSPELWKGWVKCSEMTAPQSYPVLLQLPAEQLEDAINQVPVLKDQLASHILSNTASMPRTTLALLGVIPEAEEQEEQTEASPDEELEFVL
eukprot:jgi/Chlat1/3539/Chrsp23S03713